MFHTAFDTFDNFANLVDPTFTGAESLGKSSKRVESNRQHFSLHTRIHIYIYITYLNVVTLYTADVIVLSAACSFYTPTLLTQSRNKAKKETFRYSYKSTFTFVIYVSSNCLVIRLLTRRIHINITCFKFSFSFLPFIYPDST